MARPRISPRKPFRAGCISACHGSVSVLRLRQLPLRSIHAAPHRGHAVARWLQCTAGHAPALPAACGCGRHASVIVRIQRPSCRCARMRCHSELAGPSLRAVRCSGFNHAPARARSLGAGDRSSLPDNHFHHIASVLTLGHRSAAADGVGLDGRAADPSGNALRLPDRALADELSDWRARPPPRWSLKWRAVPCTHTLAC